MYTGNADQKLAGLEDLSHAVLETAANELTFGAAGKVGSYLAKHGKFAEELFPSRRAYLNKKFGRTGELNLDISKRGYLEQLEKF